MATRKGEGYGKVVAYNKGAWTAEEDAKLAHYVEIHGPKKWNTLAIKSDLKRCGRSCRLRWLNYLRPNIKRGNISSEEEDLIIRLHKLLGNRWSLIAGRIPGRNDNEIKNYWNSCLSKKSSHKEVHVTTSRANNKVPTDFKVVVVEEECINQGSGDTSINFDVDEFFDFSIYGTCGLEWVNEFLELDDDVQTMT